MSVFDRVRSPQDLKALAPDEVAAYCAELRAFLIRAVTATGGHLGSNLGVVELTVALHRVFDFKTDRLVLDTSHQVYPHKVITGRGDRFPTLRRTDGLSGFMHRGESPYDTFTSGHAGTAVSAAAGLALADKLRGIDDRRVVAIVGDAAAASGVTFEALNDVGQGDTNLLVILNDNQWSISRTVGALRKYLNRIRTLPAYREGKGELHEALGSVPFFGDRLSRWVGNVKEAFANAISPGHLFRELGWTYFGPENGHDVHRMEQLLHDLKRVKGPVLLHVVTEKGRGAPDKGHEAAHAVSEPKLPRPAGEPQPLRSSEPVAPVVKYQDVFAHTMKAVMDHDPRVVAITAAMPSGTSLDKVAPEHAERVIDVGICEQHGVALAGGLADAGMKPVVAIYSTFLQRGYDQIWQEVVVQGLPVVFAMDRAGIVGGDGVTHQGLYDIAYLRTFPDIVLMAPADPPELERMLRHALSLGKPSAVRYPRGGHANAPLAGNDTPLRTGRGELLRDGKDMVFLAYGNLVREALAAADELAEVGIEAAVFNARFARPLDTRAIDRFLDSHRLVMTVEEHAIAGGFGSAVLEHVATLPTPPAAVVRVLGVPDQLVWHGEAADWRERFGLDARGLAARARRELTALATRPSEDPSRSAL
ncbi:MAG: 1-deoxy-D-xylulose-5-phosphate synthase [Planctomycetota bacterium]